MTAEAAITSQRLDAWLWRARFFKTRSLSAKFVSGSGVRLTRSGETNRIDKPATLVRPGDSLTLQIGKRLFVVDILACAERRGPAPEARRLYDDRSPPPPPKEETVQPEGGARPTKRDRRALDALRRSAEEPL